MDAMNRTYTFALDVPFRDNDRASTLGAKWYAPDKMWRVDCTARQAAMSFANWDPRVYLDVPFDEKNAAKKEGAKWDNRRRRWYIDHHMIPYAQVEMWLSTTKSRLKATSTSRNTQTNKNISASNVALSIGNGGGSVNVTYTTIHVEPKKASATGKKKTSQLPKKKSQSPKTKSQATTNIKPTPPTGPAHTKTKREVPSPKGRARAGNAKAATALRISEDMTVSQLQDECRLRGVRGFSNKTKDWLLEQLVVGSIWDSASSAASSAASSTKKNASSSSSSATKRGANQSTNNNIGGRKKVKTEEQDYYPEHAVSGYSRPYSGYPNYEYSSHSQSTDSDGYYC
jgi:Domain of unknown function (DUF5710)